MSNKTGKDHNFNVVTFTAPAWCALCGKMIWGLFQGGEQCKVCSFPVHKECKPLVPLAQCPGGKRNWAEHYETRQKMKVKHHYTAAGSDEISLQQGEVVSLIEVFPNGWSRIEKKSIIALFPTNHLEIIKQEPIQKQNINTPIKSNLPSSASNPPKKPQEGWGITSIWGAQKTQNEKIIQAVIPDSEKVKKIEMSLIDIEKTSKKDFEELGKLFELYSKQLQALHDIEGKVIGEISKLGERYQNHYVGPIYSQVAKDLEKGESERIFFSNSVRNIAMHLPQDVELPLKTLKQTGIDKKMRSYNKELDLHMKEQSAKIPVNEISPKKLIPITLGLKKIIEEINENRDEQISILQFYKDQTLQAPVCLLQQWMTSHIKYSKAITNFSEIPEEWGKKLSEKSRKDQPFPNFDTFKPSEFDSSILEDLTEDTQNVNYTQQTNNEYWIAYQTEEGIPYYYNQETEETTWDRPNVPDQNITQGE